MSTLQDKLDQLSPERRHRVEQRAAMLVAEEMTLRQLRQAVRHTQVDVAQRLGINQENVSRLEQRDDLLLSSLNRYIAALGGKLSLVAEFPDSPPILLTGIGPDEPPEQEADWSTFTVRSLASVSEDAPPYSPADKRTDRTA